MFKTISRLLFGGEEEEAPKDVKSGEVVEEGWTVVTHQEVSLAENQDTLLTDSQPSDSTLHGNTAANMETDCVPDLEPTVETSSSSSSIATSQVLSGPFYQPKALPAITQLSCIQKAKAWADRHHASRNAIQRQNRIRQGVQHHSFYLQQPGHRSLGH